MRALVCGFVLILLSSVARAETSAQMVTLDDIELHYSSYPSTFLPASVARGFGIQRSNKVAIVMISPRRDNQPVDLDRVEGVARNLLGVEKKLTFRRLEQQDGLYYISEVGYNNEETFRFRINVRAIINEQPRSTEIAFEKKFYVD